MVGLHSKEGGRLVHKVKSASMFPVVKRKYTVRLFIIRVVVPFEHEVYHESEQQDVIMICRWILEIEFLLLCQLRSNTMVEKVKSRNHHSRNKCSKDVQWRDPSHILQFDYL